MTSGTTLTSTTPVTLSFDNGEGLVFSREISLSDDYVFTIKQGVENKSQAAVSLIPYARVQRQDTPVVAGFYVFFEGMLGVQDGTLTEAKYDDVAEEDGKISKDSKGGWIAFTDKYWATALIPDQSRALTSTYQHFKIGNRDAYQVDWLGKEAVTVAPGSATSTTDHIYAGAKIVNSMYTIGEKYGIDKFDLMIDWGWFYFLTKPMYKLLHFANSFLGNFGLAILSSRCW